MRLASEIVERIRREPNWFIREFLGLDLYDLQQKIIQAVFTGNKRRVAVASCHSIGKTTLTAAAILTFLFAFPGESKVIFTAPTWRQVSNVIWAYVRAIYAKARIPLGGNMLTIPRFELSPDWFCLGFSARTSDFLQGFHAPKILIIVDEAPGVNEDVMKGIRGLMASGDVRVLLMGNPTSASGEFGRAFMGSRHMYEAFQVGCWDTPNFTAIRNDCMTAKTKEERWAIMRSAPLVRDYLIRPSFVADMEEEFGADSDIVKVRCLGQFPQGGDDHLVSIQETEEAVYRWEELESGDGWWLPENHLVYPGPIYGGLDVARFGKNRSVLALQSRYQFGFIRTWQGLDTVDLVGHVEQDCRQWRVDAINIDETGLGGGPLDNARRWDINTIAHGYLGGGSAKNPDRFCNLRAESFWNVRELHKAKIIAYPRQAKLMGQLSEIKYEFKQRQRILMSAKEDLEESTDEADAVAMACDHGEIVEGRKSKNRLTDWSKMHGRR